MNKITYKLLLLLGLLAMTATSFAASEAEYGKVSKAWTLHADGSQEYRSSMELTLFTHTAMNSTYGESFIVYNPDFQTLKIHSSYTRQKDGTIVKTPNNAFVEVLPRFAANAPAYNRLKEMVVVHTGLELGATIYLDYSIITKPGYYPALDINERLQETSPVKECKVSISVPENNPLTWQLSGSNVKASQVTRNGVKEVSWTLRNLPASSREAFLPQNQDGVPRLIASSYTSNKEALSTLNKRFNASGNYESKTFGPYITEKATNDEEKVKAIQDHVVNNMGYCAIPLACTGYSIRNVDEALRSAYGTLAEKTQLLNVLLNAAGIQSEVVAVYPGNLDINACGLSAIKTLAVKATLGGKDKYLSATSLAPSVLTARGELDKVITLNGTPISLQAEPMIIKEHKAVSVSKEQARNGFAICTLPAITGGIDGWGMSTLNSKRSNVFELPSLIREEVTYTVTPAEGMKLQTSTKEQVINKPFGKVTRTITPKGNTIEVIRTIEVNKQQFTPAEYDGIRSLINEWINPDNRVLLFSL
ncbi:DUF3857 domain-containing protein [uncultured Parabacteroides sp.]|uniref:DUF3857 domain-containing protein n=1 Tax=uncultured Parabacteroides sp. TaxID=512312 RepID=UPI00262D39E7|nr:DUF3857 domain-containing protein [uncultured Parabacteroides sp.]